MEMNVDFLSDTLILRKNNFKLCFKNELSDCEIFSVEKGGHRLTVSLLDKEGVPTTCFGRKIMKPIDETQVDSKENPILLFSLRDGKDMLCTVCETRIKCDIILKRQKTFMGCSFLIDCSDLLVVQENNFAVSLIDITNFEQVFNLSQAFVFNSKTFVSSEMFYDLGVLENGKFKLSVLPNNEVLKSDNCDFPLIIHFEILLFGDNL